MGRVFLLPPILQVLSDTQEVLGTFCGQENSPDGNDPGNQPILSPSNKLSVVLRTDESNSQQHTGFSAHYKAIGQLSVMAIVLPLRVSTLVHCTRRYFSWPYFESPDPEIQNRIQGIWTIQYTV